MNQPQPNGDPLFGALIAKHPGLAEELKTMDCLTPQCDELERSRKALKQDRTPAYGDALALARRLERELSQAKAEIERLADSCCEHCGCDANDPMNTHSPNCPNFES